MGPNVSIAEARVQARSSGPAAPAAPCSPAPRKLAFVLSGGGALGSLQVGIIEALVERGIRPDLIVGTSVGSLNGAWLARDPSMEGVRYLKEVWGSLRPDNIFRGGSLRVILRMLAGREHVYTDAGLRELLGRHFGDATFADLSVPLYVTATDLDTGELRAFHQGPLVPALLASSALPGVFPAVTIEGHSYADGGILSHCSIETAWSAQATHIVIIECPHQPPPRNAYGIMRPISKAFSAAVSRLCQLEVERFQLHCPTLLLWPEMKVDSYRLEDFSKITEWMVWAKAWAHEFLEKHGHAFLEALKSPAPLPQRAAA